jgi:hypothetical protein
MAHHSTTEVEMIDTNTYDKRIADPGGISALLMDEIVEDPCEDDAQLEDPRPRKTTRELLREFASALENAHYEIKQVQPETLTTPLMPYNWQQDFFDWKQSFAAKHLAHEIAISRLNHDPAKFKTSFQTAQENSQFRFQDDPQPATHRPDAPLRTLEQLAGDQDIAFMVETLIRIENNSSKNPEEVWATAKR